METAAFPASMVEHGMQLQDHANVQNPFNGMDTLVQKLMPAPMVKFGMCILIVANALRLHSGMEIAALLFLNVKEDKSSIAIINAVAPIIMFGSKMVAFIHLVLVVKFGLVANAFALLASISMVLCAYNVLMVRNGIQ